MRKYLLDENVGESLRKGLHAHYPDIADQISYLPMRS